MKKTNPFGSAEEEKDEAGDPLIAMQQIQNFVSRQQETQRRRGKPKK